MHSRPDFQAGEAFSAIAVPDLVAWELDEARAELARIGWTGPIALVETAPPERRAASRTPTRPGVRRVLRARLRDSRSAGEPPVLELLTARELLLQDNP